MATHGESTAKASSSFHASFAPLLETLQDQIKAATTSEQADAILGQLVQERNNLQERDLAGALTRWDKEQYEKRINLLQSELAAKRLGLQASSTPSTSKFSFRRTAKTEPQRLNAAMATSKQSNLPHSSQPPQSSNASASNVQIALQTNRFISFKDLSKALDSAADSTGLSLSLSHLTECIVDFRSMPKELVTIKATNVKKSLLLLPAVSSSIMIDGLEDSIVITQSCKQFRLHASHTAHLVVNSSSPVTIESCTGIKISTSRDELLVQDFDAPGAGPSSQPTKSWQPLSPPERAALDNAVTSLSESEAQEASQLSKLPALLPSQQARAAPTPSQTSPYRAEDAGILLVFSDPGETSTLAEFHDWYDNEHVPMRSEVYDEFRSAARYSVPVSSHSSAEASQAFAHSGWAAAYIISSNALYNDPTYVALRSKRSPREADLVARLGVLDRRIYKTLVDSVGSREASIAPMKKAEVESTASRVELIGFNTSAKSNNDEAQIAKWFAEEALPTLRSKCTHLERVKLIKLIDALVNGKQVAAGNVDAKHVADWALLADFSSPADPSAPSPLEQIALPSDDSSVIERRTMQLYRAWEPSKALAGAQTQT